MEDAEYLGLIAEGKYQEARKALDAKAKSFGALTVDGHIVFYHGSRSNKPFHAFDVRAGLSDGVFMSTSRNVGHSYASVEMETPMEFGEVQFSADDFADKWKKAKSGIGTEDGDYYAEDLDALQALANFLTYVVGVDSKVELRNAQEGIFRTALEDYEGYNFSFAFDVSDDGFVFPEDAYLGMLMDFVDDLVRNINDDHGQLFALYAFASKVLEIDASFANFESIMYNGKKWKSDELVDYAWKKGYDAVVLYNIADLGMGYRRSDEKKPYATDVIVKEPSQVKSANLVTFDDDGNIIPLSKRFSDSDDIREEDGMSEWLMSYSQRPQ